MQFHRTKKMKKHIPFLTFASLFSISLCAKNLPSDFKICKRKDPNINQCLKIAVEDAYPKLGNGLPDLGVPVLEPFNIPSAVIGEGKGPVNVKQIYNNVNIYNLINGKIDKVEASVDDPFLIHMHLSAPEYRFEADYDFNGRILVLPIVGKGKCTIRLIDIKSEIIITGEKANRKGVTYMDVKDFKVVLNPGKVNFNFENLFNGDERLGKEMNTVLNENWKEVFEDVKIGYEELIATVGKHVAMNVFSKVPYDTMFPL